MLHPEFKINTEIFNREKLCSLAQEYIAMGEDYQKDIGSFINEWLDEKPFVETFTSGTTGIPKPLRIEKAAMINSAIATGEFFNLEVGDKALLCMPTKYIAGKMMLVRALVLGLDIDFVSPSSSPLQNNSKYYEFSAMVPLQVQNSISEIRNIKKLLIGGSAINDKLREELRKLDTDIYETYGMTETITHIAAKKLSEKYFTSLPDVKISLDQRGCLVIDAPKVSKTKVETNDLVEIVNEKQFLFLGRIDNVVNSGGIKLFPEQIEDKLSSMMPARFFVAGIKDELLGEKLVMIVEGTEFNLYNKLYDDLDKYEKPKEVYFVGDFDLTESGKIKRKEILKKISKNT